MKKAICVGINNYPGTANDLNGCINDANDWADLLESFGFEINKILDEQATKSNILNAFKALISSVSAGDVAVFTYSGHGTQVIDTSSDEQDTYDEAIYVYDGPIVDDEFRAVLDAANNDARIILITDSCFSGTITKALVSENAKPRFYRTDFIPANALLNKPFLTKAAGENMVEIVLTGCNDKEYSYDAHINGRWNGAMTASVIPIIEPDQTYNELYTKLRTMLPSSEYPQTPQLEGSEVDKNSMIFTEKTGSGAGSDTNPGNNPVSSGCFSVLLSIMAIAAIIVVVVLKII